MASSALGSRLRLLRQQRRLTLAQMGESVGVSLGVVNHWEQGRTNVPAELVPDIADALGVTISEFYGRDELDTGSGKTEALVRRLTRIFETIPERIELNVYQGSYHRRTQVRPEADVDLFIYLDPGVFVAAEAKGLSFTKKVIAEWGQIPEQARQEWRELAAANRGSADE